MATVQCLSSSCAPGCPLNQIISLLCTLPCTYEACAAGAAMYAALGSMLLRCAIPAPALLALGSATQLQCSVSLASGSLRVHSAFAASPRLSSPAPHLLATLARGMREQRVPLGSGSDSCLLPSQLGSAGTAWAWLPVGAVFAGLGPRPGAFAKLSEARADGIQPGGYLCPPALADGCLQLGAALAAAAQAPDFAAGAPALRVPSAIGAYCVASERAPQPGGRRACPAPSATAALGGALPGRGALSSYRLHTQGFLPDLQLADLVAAPIARAPSASAVAASKSVTAELHLMYQVAWLAAQPGAVPVLARLHHCRQRCRTGVRWALTARTAAQEATNTPHVQGYSSAGTKDTAAGCLAGLAFLQANANDANASISLRAQGGCAHVCEPAPASRMGGLNPRQGNTTGSATQGALGGVAAAWALAKVAVSEHPGLRFSVTINNAATVAERLSMAEAEDAFGTLLSGSATFSPRLLRYDSPSSQAGAQLAGIGGAIAVAGGLGGETA